MKQQAIFFLATFLLVAFATIASVGAVPMSPEASKEISINVAELQGEPSDFNTLAMTEEKN